MVHKRARGCVPCLGCVGACRVDDVDTPSAGGVLAGEPGPNPGYIFAQRSSDGVTFAPMGNASAPLYSQRDVDVKFDRSSGQFVLVQGDGAVGCLCGVALPCLRGDKLT